MSMTITQANAVNNLLRWVLDDAGDGDERVTASEALAAAEVLAEGANKTLSAGLRGKDVRRLWARAGRDRHPLREDGSG